MAVLLDQFVETLSESGLISAAEVETFLGELAADEKPESAERAFRPHDADGGAFPPGSPRRDDNWSATSRAKRRWLSVGLDPAEAATRARGRP